jgi:hypothetical protein
MGEQIIWHTHGKTFPDSLSWGGDRWAYRRHGGGRGVLQGGREMGTGDPNRFGAASKAWDGALVVAGGVVWEGGSSKEENQNEARG